MKNKRITSIEQLEQGVKEGKKIGSESLDSTYSDDGQLHANRESFLVFCDNGKVTITQAKSWIKSNGFTDKCSYPIY